MYLLSDLLHHSRLTLEGFTDWHSHILPGVDDGVRSMDDSLEILAAYERMGIRALWLTPHIMEDVPNTTASLRSRFAELKQAYRGPLTLHLGAENMIDSLFSERLLADDLLPMGERRDMLLVETSVFSAPIGFDDTLREIRRRGYHPLLAHPERYAYLDSIEAYRRLKDTGVRFQLNLLSLDGAYGRAVSRKAHDLLKAGMYDLAGTDLHSPAQLDRYASLSLPAASARRLAPLVNPAQPA